MTAPRRWPPLSAALTRPRPPAGTHGYLPPECYEGESSRICPKVDVFSAGVVWFTMLFYPAKPFFADASQQQIMQMSSHSMRTEAQRLAIPDCKPALSKEVQEALRRCLAPSRADRPDAAACELSLKRALTPDEERGVGPPA